VSPAGHSDIAPPLPANVEAERCILGSALLDNQALNDAVQTLCSQDFFLTQHRHIFDAMVELRENIDSLTLLEKLTKSGRLDSAGGVGYISQLADGLPHVTNVRNYAQIVKEKAVLRRLIHSAAAIQDRAFAGEDPLAIIETGRQTFANLESSTSPEALFETFEEFKSAKPLRSLIENVFHADVCNVVGGLSGDGKTMILLAITRALLSYEPLFGYFSVLERAEKVIYLVPESARAPFFHRCRLFGIDRYIESGRLLVRTLSKGPRIQLNDPRLLSAVKGTVVLIDTAVRFGTGDENDATCMSNGLASDIFNLIAAGAEAVGVAHHAPKSFEKDNRITLENILRGSGDFGAFVGAGFGIRQIDEDQNIIHIQDIKPRESKPLPPFQIVGRPHIDRQGDFRMHLTPDLCGPLSNYLDCKNRGGAPREARDMRASNIRLVKDWLGRNPELSGAEVEERFRSMGIHIAPSTVRKYMAEVH